MGGSFAKCCYIAVPKNGIYFTSLYIDSRFSKQLWRSTSYSLHSLQYFAALLHFSFKLMNNLPGLAVSGTSSSSSSWTGGVGEVSSRMRLSSVSSWTGEVGEPSSRTRLSSVSS